MNKTASTALTAWQAFWSARQARERRLILLAACLIGTALFWQIALAPALQTWREAPSRQAALDAQTTQMLQWQAQAKGFQAQAPLPRTEALQKLESSAAQWLGPDARVSLQGEQVRITFKAAPADGLSRWLAQARSQAQALPLQAQLQRATPSSPAVGTPAAPSIPASTTSGATAVWSGTLVLGLR